MNPPAGKSLWEQTVAAARRQTAPVATSHEDLPPPGFAVRLASRWAELKQNEGFRRWCRWSLWAAIAGLAAAGATHFLLPPSPVPLPLRAPQVEIPPLSPP